ncbi:MAG: HEAT repeat domain-containing protein [Cyanobacteria bacterium J06626_23]
MASIDSIQTALQSEDFGDRLRGINQLREIDPAVAFELIQGSVSDRNTRVRYAAVSQISELGKQNPDQALEILKRALHEDPEADVQAAAADAIGALGLTAAYDDLARVYHSTSEWLVQMSILACLGELGEAKAFDLLSEAIKSDNSLLVVTAIGALGELQDERALPLLLPFAQHPDWQTRHRLAQALGHHDSPTARAALEQLAQDETELVAEAAKAQLTA